jgi:hypothetical protein
VVLLDVRLLNGGGQIRRLTACSSLPMSFRGHNVDNLAGNDKHAYNGFSLD